MKQLLDLSKNKAVANQRATCECASTVPSWRKSLLVLIHSPWTGIHTVLQWDRNGCGSASMSNYCSPLCQPVTGWAKQWPGADMALTALRITEADHKCEVNNYLFQICSMHEGNMAGNSTLLIESELSFEQWVQNHSPASVLKCSWRGFNMHQMTNYRCGIGMISAMWKQP